MSQVSLTHSCCLRYRSELVVELAHIRNLDNGDLRTVQDWIRLLSFATKFSLISICELAIKRLTPLTSAVEKIFEGNLYGVDEWIVPALTELCLQKELLTLEKSLKIHARDLHLVARIREVMKWSNLPDRDREDMAKAMIKKEWW